MGKKITVNIFDKEYEMLLTAEVFFNVANSIKGGLINLIMSIGNEGRALTEQEIATIIFKTIKSPLLFEDIQRFVFEDYIAANSAATEYISQVSQVLYQDKKKVKKTT